MQTPPASKMKTFKIISTEGWIESHECDEQIKLFNSAAISEGRCNFHKVDKIHMVITGQDPMWSHFMALYSGHWPRYRSFCYAFTVPISPNSITNYKDDI